MKQPGDRAQRRAARQAARQAGGAGRPRRRGLRALALAWLLLLLAVGGALAYAFLTYEGPGSEPSVTPPPRFEEAPVPAPGEPAGPAPGATGHDAAPAPSESGHATTNEPLQEPAPATGHGAQDGAAPAHGDAPAAEGEAQGHGSEAPAADAQASAAHSTPGDGTAGHDTPGHDTPSHGQQAALPQAPHPEPPAAPLEPAWERFAMPYAGATNLPRIAVVVTGLGLHDSLTQQAIESLPPGITLSFSPYARGVETWLAQARAKGHEVMLDLPMEPQSYPNSDPGHFALFVSKSEEENLERLKEILGRGSAYVGLAAVMGSRFTADADALRPVLAALGQRGLIFLDNRESDAGVAAELGRQLGVPTLYNDRTLDGEFVQANAIDSRLAQVERLARTKGVAVAMANVYPTTFKQLELWVEGLREKGLALAPITGVLGRQPPAE